MRYLYETVVKIGFKIIVAPYETFNKIETFEADSLLHRPTIYRYRYIVVQKLIVLRSCISMNLIELIVSFIFLNNHVKINRRRKKGSLMLNRGVIVGVRSCAKREEIRINFE